MIYIPKEGKKTISIAVESTELCVNFTNYMGSCWGSLWLPSSQFSQELTARDEIRGHKRRGRFVDVSGF